MNRKPEQGGVESAPMEQVRDLLFGAQLKEMENRFLRQEERFTREVSDSQVLLQNRLDSLESFMKNGLAQIVARIKDEHDEREEALRDEQRERQNQLKTEQKDRAEHLEKIAEEIKALADGFERKLTKVANLLDHTERELRRLVLEESNRLSGQTNARYQDALAVVASTASQIRHDMVYRSALSGMFTDVVMRLGEPAESGLPLSSDDLAPAPVRLRPGAQNAAPVPVPVPVDGESQV